jgi:alkylated DNA nucleotide flippase Atl1
VAPRVPFDEHAERVLEVVASIPAGRVMAYGDVGRALGDRGPRYVGNVMAGYASDLPWWRVVRADGRPPLGHEDEAVRRWLEEGVPVVGGPLAAAAAGAGARADMARARWVPESPASVTQTGPAGSRGSLHHVEVWVDDLAVSGPEWGRLLARLGYRLGDDWGHGQAWELGSLYVVVESGPDVVGGHERRRAGVNHLAFHAGTRADVDAVVEHCAEAGWSLLFADRHPYAGGPQHYAAYLESSEGFEVELVAADGGGPDEARDPASGSRDKT